LQSFANNTQSNQKENYKQLDSQGFKAVLDQAFGEDSHWITPYLWNGAVPYLGAPAIAFVGSYETIATALMQYKEIGITQFLFMGWPDEVEIIHFGQGVAPLLRAKEKEMFREQTIRN
jgi:alkanesulfonate monooxygenase